jgi:AraC family transcriptional activator of pobA
MAIGMAKEKIPVYDICSLKKEQHGQNDFTVERFAAYLRKHYQNLHKAHRHSFYHLVLFTSGAGTHSVDFTTFDVTPGQIYFMAPGQVHSWHFEGAVDGYIINFSDTLFRSFLLNPRYIEQFIFFNGASEDGVIQLPPQVYEKATALFEDMLACFDKEGDNTLDMIRLLLLQLFITVDGSGATSMHDKVPQQKQRLLNSLRRLIDEHYRKLRLPKEYADLLYVTPNHLNALCKDVVGKTAGELIRDRILLEAKRLLTNATMTATDIAYELNFKDNSYFNRFFKKYTGVTPDDFRQQFNA